MTFFIHKKIIKAEDPIKTFFHICISFWSLSSEIQIDQHTEWLIVHGNTAVKVNIWGRSCHSLCCHRFRLPAAGAGSPTHPRNPFFEDSYFPFGAHQLCTLTSNDHISWSHSFQCLYLNICPSDPAHWSNSIGVRVFLLPVVCSLRVVGSFLSCANRREMRDLTDPFAQELCDLAPRFSVEFVPPVLLLPALF